MNPQTARKLRYYVRLHYPVQVTALQDGFWGRFLDLPGCELAGDDIRQLYADLERRRREWIARHLMRGEEIPLPNSHLKAQEPKPQRQRRPAERAAVAAAC